MEYWLIPLRHDGWATRSMLEWCRKLTGEQFQQKFDMGCGSLHDTFRHMIAATGRWSDRIAERPVRPSPQDDPRARSIDELLEMHRIAAADLESVARNVQEQNLYTDIIEWPRQGKPPYRFTKASALVHVTTHGVHHRAQARWMMRQLGIDFGNRDFDPIEMELEQAGQFE